jgi:hypothetical protein
MRRVVTWWSTLPTFMKITVMLVIAAAICGSYIRSRPATLVWNSMLEHAELICPAMPEPEDNTIGAAARSLDFALLHLAYDLFWSEDSCRGAEPLR